MNAESRKREKRRRELHTRSEMGPVLADSLSKDSKARAALRPTPPARGRPDTVNVRARRGHGQTATHFHSSQDKNFPIIVPRFAPAFRVELSELLEVDASLRAGADEGAFLLPL